MRAHAVSASTQDKYGNERINKQNWNHIAPWERKHYRAITSVAMREGWREVVGRIYSLLIHFHPSSGDGSLPWSFASHRCVRSSHLMTVVQGWSGNRLQEARTFDWNVTLIHKIWYFPPDVRVGEEDGGVVLSDISWCALVEQHVLSRGVNVFFWSKL